jgi:uncharacterized protein YvpB
MVRADRHPEQDPGTEFATQARARSRGMLVHSRAKPRQQVHTSSADAQRAYPATMSDPLAIVFITLLVFGLVTIAMSVWFLLMRPWSMSGNASAQPPLLSRSNSRLAAQLESAEATRQAQQTEIDLLRTELGRVRQDLSAVTAQATAAAARLDAASTVLNHPPLALILDVPIYKQQRNLSCESSAAAMAANFCGLQVSEQDILSALPRHENPHRGFRGDVDGPHGGIDDYGVYAEPVRQVLTDLGLEVRPLDGGADEIRRQIRHGHPVIAWITYELQVQSPQQITLSDGQVATVVPYEHTVLVVGYNPDGLWVNDPYDGTQRFYAQGEFDRSFAYLGNMGLIVAPAGDIR